MMATARVTELKLRPDVMGSMDGLSKYPYIRESRRLQALRQVRMKTQESASTRMRARWFEDSVGLASHDRYPRVR
jgi:hypothetical protein